MHVGENESHPLDNTTKRKLEAFLDKWSKKKKTIHYGKNIGYHPGAMKAMDDGFQNGWFDGYDWLVRINPDVIIYDEIPMFSFMDRPDVSAVIAKCHYEWGENKKYYWQINTDFFAVRPE